MTKKKIRHIMGLSGGKDSTALAILLHNIIPDLEFFFCDTEKELPETYQYINKVETRLGITVQKLAPMKSFDYFLELFGGYLPSQQARWCTKELKISPLEAFIGDEEAYSYIGIRADEDRTGYVSSRPNIKPVYLYKAKDFVIERAGKTFYSQAKIVKDLKEMGINLPVRDDGYNLADVQKVINDSGIGMPDYYKWRTRSGCFFCFFQRKFEWVGLAERHPKLFEEAAAYEKELPDGRRFTWNQGESLNEILARKEQIVTEHHKRMESEKKNAPDKPLCEIFETALNDEDDDEPCLICTL